MSMKSSIRQVGDVTVVDISGRIVIGEESAALRELIHDLISHQHNKILLNLRDVNVMQVTKLYTVFDIMNDEMVAIKSFGQSSTAAV